ncbi:MAG: hypothetical protein IPG72_09565 [Ardenticatenales bacterium]|nr:hypothetical protein [Ardenticatenales bacterium]
MSARVKLPVPAAWQSAVKHAMAHLAVRLGVPRSAVAVTRADDDGGIAGHAGRLADGGRAQLSLRRRTVGRAAGGC